jgi:hypothetical protein
MRIVELINVPFWKEFNLLLFVVMVAAMLVFGGCSLLALTVSRQWLA